MKKYILTLSFLGVAVTAGLFAQAKPDAQKAMEHVDYLASNAFKGRKSGTPEYQKAAEYVAAKMKEYGLQPGGDNGTYFQEVEFKNWRHFEPPTRLEITSPKHMVLIPGSGWDFRPNQGTGSGIAKGQLVFVGYGLISKQYTWDDYQDLDVKGKIVMMLPGAPDFMDKLEKKLKSLETKIKTAVDKQAAGIIFMNVGEGVPGWRYPSGAKIGTCPENFVVMTLSEQMSSKLFYMLDLSWRDMISRTIREEKSFTCPLELSAEMEAHYTQDTRTAPNVIGILPGKDPKLKEEYILLGGHLDHLGVDFDGAVYNGADDNAGSAAVMLEIARVFQLNNYQPDRTVIMAAWAGEELGLVGSRHYTKKPNFPLEKTVIYMNMDMVATGDDDLYVGGMWWFAEFFDLLKENLPDKFNDKLNYRLDYRGSDHSAFLPTGVTTISLRTGNVLTRDLDDEHPEYHRLGDAPNTIRPELLAMSAEYHIGIISFLAKTRENLFNPMYKTQFIHKAAVVADLHCDTIGRFMEGDDLSQDNAKGHIDIPKMKQGALDLQVFACYVGPPENELKKNQAATRAFKQIDAVHQLIDENPEDLELILYEEHLRRLRGTRKTGIMIGIEGGYAIENDLRLLRSFYRSGVRLMTLTHWLATDWADASGDKEPLNGGLTKFGEDVVKEMNKLGMIIDASHVHDETFWDVIEVSDSPIVASHSCCRALSDYHRNLSDKMLKALAKNGGVIGINFLPMFLDIGNEDNVDIKTVVDHIDHVVKITGNCNHVGLGSDFDGISRTPLGLENVSKLPAITAELHRRGYKESDIKKILGGNFLRVLKKVCSENK